MRYAISFTPSLYDPLAVAAASWLGRSIYSGDACEQPHVPGIGRQELAFHTAVPRRYGFHGAIRSPFHLRQEQSEAALLKAMMTFAGAMAPFDLPPLDVARLGTFYGLIPQRPCEVMNHLAASVVQAFDSFCAPLSDADIERRDPHALTAAQFANLLRWGCPSVMDEFRFHMMLTGSVGPDLYDRFDAGLRGYFAPFLGIPLKVRSLALLIEPEPGAPLLVHSQHPLGKLPVHRPRLPQPSPDTMMAGIGSQRITEAQAAIAVRRLPGRP